MSRSDTLIVSDNECCPVIDELLYYTSGIVVPSKPVAICELPIPLTWQKYNYVYAG